VLLRAAATVALIALPAIASAATTNPSGLPLPRFVTIRSFGADGTVHVGPGFKYDVAWTYTQPGAPVEVIQEFDVWRKIRDVDGWEGWVQQSTLGASRAGYILGTLTGELGLRASPSDDARIVAWVGPGFPVKLQTCDGSWCAVVAADHPQGGSITSYSGFVPEADLWGVYQGEKFD
jgi:SH3-like domain-containing protein